MNGSLASNIELAKAVAASNLSDNVQVAVCPPMLHVSAVAEQIKGTKVGLGTQTLSEHDNGAYTGEISANMLTEMGVSYVLCGHSERRALFGETDKQVADKVKAALAAGLTPVLCVGETDAEREAGETLAVIERQIRAVLDLQDVFPATVVAYEPVWAIGTGKTATAEQAQAVHLFIRTLVGSETQILYGGSVKATNAGELFAMADIDGGLIGGAALDATSFAAICNAVR